MTVKTGGPIRGLMGRWLMRLEAAGSILRMAFLGVTAASTLTSALALVGYQQYAPAVLVIGVLATFVFAFGYVEYGVFNRKNRERADFGDNYSGPTMLMDRQLDAVQRAYLVHAIQNGETDLETLTENMTEVTAAQWREYRDGLNTDEIHQ